MYDKKNICIQSKHNVMKGNGRKKEPSAAQVKKLPAGLVEYMRKNVKNTHRAKPGHDKDKKGHGKDKKMK